jgi:hypothetical protein
MSNVIVSSFPDRARADAAVRVLHEEGFRRTWLAAIGAGREEVREIGGNPLRRWFHADSNRTLYDALRDREVDDDQAQRIDASVGAGNCVLLVEGANDPRCAEELIERAGGEIMAAPEALRTAPGGPDDPMAHARVVAAERDELRQRRMGIAPVVREDVFIERVHVPIERVSEPREMELVR